jgi:hypothetical protein
VCVDLKPLVICVWEIDFLFEVGFGFASYFLRWEDRFWVSARLRFIVLVFAYTDLWSGLVIFDLSSCCIVEVKSLVFVLPH